MYRRNVTLERPSLYVCSVWDAQGNAFMFDASTLRSWYTMSGPEGLADMGTDSPIELGCQLSFGCFTCELR